MVTIGDAVFGVAKVGDAVFGVILLLFLVFGYRKGMSIGLFTVTGLVVLVVLVVVFAAPVGRAIGGRFGWQERMTSSTGFVILLGVGLLLFFGLRILLRRLLLRWPGGFMSSVAGALIWGTLGLVFIVLCLSVLLVSHSDTFYKVAYERSAVCQRIFDKVPLMRDLKARIDRISEREPTVRKHDYEKMLDTKGSDDEAETDP